MALDKNKATDSARAADRASMLDLLRHNGGFDRPEEWVDVARRERFRRVSSFPIAACPDCGHAHHALVGQYVHYSTLIKLLRCPQCDLIWADRRLADDVVQDHFEHAYKDEAYFQITRKQVFEHLCDLIAALTPQGGCLLDYGGAKGHLLRRVRAVRPDLKQLLIDLSEAACKSAEQEPGVTAYVGGAERLASVEGQVDIIVFSDVFYYIPQIREVWELLPKAMRSKGVVILRIPNKLLMIRAYRTLARLLRLAGQSPEDKLRFFNPEHNYILTRRYLRRRFKAAGFDSVEFLPTSPTSQGAGKALLKLYTAASNLVSWITARRVVITPSMLVVARKA